MTRTALIALALTLGLTGCGGGDEEAVGPTPTPSTTSAPTGATSACPDGAPSTDLAKKPAVHLPAGSTSPDTTTFTDVVLGTGAEAKDGSNVAVKYLGVLFSDCSEFDSSWSRGADETLPFRVGAGVIPGFSKGVTGMKVGGRRQVVIPAAEGYGDQGGGPIPPGATLVFVIDLVTVS